MARGRCNDPDVVAELGLSDEQKAKLAAADEENNKAFEKAVEDSGRDDWRQRAGELGEEADKRLLGVLTEEQQKQFEAMEGEEFNVDLSQLFRGGAAAVSGSVASAMPFPACWQTETLQV